MIINQLLERTRKNGRRGSCGLGFGETIERSLSSPHALTVAGLRLRDFKSILVSIRAKWVPSPLLALGVTDLSQVEFNLVPLHSDYDSLARGSAAAGLG